MSNHALIDAMIAQLPPADTVWPVEKRRKWLTAMTSVIDLVYSIQDAQPGEAAGKGPKPLTQNQTFVLDFLRGKAGEDGYATQSLQQIAQGAGVPMGSLANIIDALVMFGRLEKRTSADQKTPTSYRVIDND